MKYIKKWTGTVLTAGLVFSMFAGTAQAAKPSQSHCHGLCRCCCCDIVDETGRNKAFR